MQHRLLCSRRREWSYHSYQDCSLLMAPSHHPSLQHSGILSGEQQFWILLHLLILHCPELLVQNALSLWSFFALFLSDDWLKSRLSFLRSCPGLSFLLNPHWTLICLSIRSTELLRHRLYYPKSIPHHLAFSKSTASEDFEPQTQLP